MKTVVAIASLLLVGWSTSSASAGVNVSFGAFYGSLGAHGEWLHVDGGVYAWRPRGVASGWRPYYEGRWVWTDEGWYWASDEPWAWAAYHYGRWYNDDYYGWVWVPGYDWAPAWVEWRYGGGCVGWAPLSPYAVFSLSWGIHYTRHWATPMNYWTFVDSRYISDPSFHRHVYRGQDVPRVIGRTRGAGSVMYDGNHIVSRGPERSYVERVGRVPVARAEMVNVNSREENRVVAGNGGRMQVDVYRLRLNASDHEQPGRPESVKQGSRRLNLDIRDTDVQRHVVAQQQGRDMARANEYRSRNANDAQVASRRNTANGIGRSEGNPAMNRAAGDRAARINRGPIDRPPRLERMPGRVDPPERIIRRSPEQRPAWNRGGNQDRGGQERGAQSHPQPSREGARQGASRR